MAEPTTSSLIQAIFTLTFLPFFLHLLTSTWTFLHYLDRQAPSHRQFLRKLSRFKHAPEQKKVANIATIFRINTNPKRKKMPRKTHLLASSKQVDCRVDRALHVKYLCDNPALSVFFAATCDVREKIAWRVRKFFMAHKFIIGNRQCGKHYKLPA
jgi:hypothetical protein